MAGVTCTAIDVFVRPVNDPPVLHAPALVFGEEDAFVPLPGVSVTDSDLWESELLSGSPFSNTMLVELTASSNATLRLAQYAGCDATIYQENWNGTLVPSFGHLGGSGGVPQLQIPAEGTLLSDAELAILGQDPANRSVSYAFFNRTLALALDSSTPGSFASYNEQYIASGHATGSPYIALLCRLDRMNEALATLQVRGAPNVAGVVTVDAIANDLGNSDGS